MGPDTWEAAAREAIARQLHWHGFDQAARAIRASGLSAARGEDGRSHIRIACRDHHLALLRSMTRMCRWQGKGPGPLDAAVSKLLGGEFEQITFHFEVVEDWRDHAA